MKITNGKQFEKVAKFYLEKIEGYKDSTNLEDWHEGTDFFYHGVPIDITLYLNKNHIVEGSLTKLKGCNAWTAVRSGNGHHEFETPVLVLGFTVTKAEIAIDQLQYNGDAILEKATDKYWDAMDKMEEDKAV